MSKMGSSGCTMSSTGCKTERRSDFSLGWTDLACRPSPAQERGLADWFGSGINMRWQDRWLAGGQNASRLAGFSWRRGECWKIRGIGLGGALLDEIRVEIDRQIEICVHHAGVYGADGHATSLDGLPRQCFDGNLDFDG